MGFNSGFKGLSGFFFGGFPTKTIQTFTFCPVTEATFSILSSTADVVGSITRTKKLDNPAIHVLQELNYKGVMTK